MDEPANTIRKTARLRSSFLPGTGFALLGYPFAASIGLIFAALAIARLVLVSFSPSTREVWLASGSMLLVIFFWLVEFIIVGHIAIRPSGESAFVSRHIVWACVLAYSATILAAGCLVLNFGAFQMRGEGMLPIVYPGERILYHKRVDQAELVRGRVLTFLISPDSSWGHHGDVVLARILAAPGDTIAIRAGHYEVNGKRSGVEVSPVGQLPVVVDVPEVPEKLSVPRDGYFVVQEQPSRALDSRTISWARREDVLATKLWLVSARALLKGLR
jgi:signal peptidase I